MHGTVARLDAIIVRAAKLHLKLGGLCRLAGVEHSTVNRWKNGRTDPKESTSRCHLDRLERKLDALEGDLVRTLSPAAAVSARQRPAA